MNSLYNYYEYDFEIALSLLFIQIEFMIPKFEVQIQQEVEKYGTRLNIILSDEKNVTVLYLKSVRSEFIDFENQFQANPVTTSANQIAQNYSLNRISQPNLIKL